jgi:hypothetical protein
MKPTGRNIGMAGQYPFTVHGLRHGDAAQAMKPLRERMGKPGRHVLRNHDAGAVRREGL